MKKPKTKKCCECKKRFTLVKPLNFRCALCHVKFNEVAIKATLEECGGHLSLATLITFYNSYHDFYKKYAEVIRAIQHQGDIDDPQVRHIADCPLHPENLSFGTVKAGGLIPLTRPECSCPIQTDA